MRKYTYIYTIVLILCFSKSTHAEPNIKPTIGRLQVSLNYDIPLYRDAESTQPFDTIKFSVTPADNLTLSPQEYKISTNHKLKLRPLLHQAGGAKLVFKVVDLVKDGYQVVLNEESFATAVIKNDEYHKLYKRGNQSWDLAHRSDENEEAWFLFETWEVYLKRLAHIESKGEEKDLNVFDSIDESKPSLQLGKGIVREVNGHWARIEEPKTDSDESTPRRSGWVRWTDGRQLLISPVELQVSVNVKKYGFDDFYSQFVNSLEDPVPMLADGVYEYRYTTQNHRNLSALSSSAVTLRSLVVKNVGENIVVHYTISNTNNAHGMGSNGSYLLSLEEIVTGVYKGKNSKIELQVKCLAADTVEISVLKGEVSHYVYWGLVKHFSWLLPPEKYKLTFISKLTEEDERLLREEK